ncbi:hypothetical protein AcetOrient_orf02121 [Acetobacter orientalis]|uniref:Uncharacterized protein n=1 Tax=Acetobacter orientalis TaxID=146474 RepID=A0A2Z5ZGD4_9PROT|nr:hypothetical protein AcetOrient_orf02121 [Acetobacter orientalis]
MVQVWPALNRANAPFNRPNPTGMWVYTLGSTTGLRAAGK